VDQVEINRPATFWDIKYAVIRSGAWCCSYPDPDDVGKRVLGARTFNQPDLILDLIEDHIIFLSSGRKGPSLKDFIQVLRNSRIGRIPNCSDVVVYWPHLGWQDTREEENE
jgi:hypothetical protein